MTLIRDQKDKNDPRSIPTTKDIAQLTEQIKTAPAPSSVSQAPLDTSDATIPPEQTPEEQPILSEGDIPLEENQGQLESVSSQYPEIDFEALQQQSTFPGIPDVGETSPLLPDTSIIKPESLLTGDRFPTFHELDQYEHNLRSSYSLPQYNPVQDGFNADMSNWATRMLRSLQEPPEQSDYNKPSLNSERKGFWESYLSYWGSIFYDEGESKTVQFVNPLTTPLTETRFGEFGKGLLGGANYLLNIVGNTITGGATDVYNLVTGNRNPESNEPNFLQAIKGRDYSFSLDRSAARPLSVSDSTEKPPETVGELTKRSWVYYNPIIQVPARIIQGITGSDKLPNPFDLFLNKKDADVWLDRTLSAYEFGVGLTLDALMGTPQDALVGLVGKGSRAATTTTRAGEGVAEGIDWLKDGLPPPRLPDGSIDIENLDWEHINPRLDLSMDALNMTLEDIKDALRGYSDRAITPYQGLPNQEIPDQGVPPSIETNLPDDIPVPKTATQIPQLPQGKLSEPGSEGFTFKNYPDFQEAELATPIPSQGTPPRPQLTSDKSGFTFQELPQPELVDADLFDPPVPGLRQLPSDRSGFTYQEFPTEAPLSDLFNKGGLLQLPQTTPASVPRIMIPNQNTLTEPTAIIQQTISETLRKTDSLTPKTNLALPSAREVPQIILETTPEKIIKQLELPNSIGEVPEAATDIVRRTNVELTDLAVETGDIAPRLTPLSDTEIDILRMTFGDKYSRMGVNLMNYRFGEFQDLDPQKLVKDTIWSKLIEPDLTDETVAIAKVDLPQSLRTSDNELTSKYLQSKNIVDNLANEASDLKLKISQSEQSLARNLDYLDTSVDAGRKNIFTNIPAPQLDPLTPVIPRNPKLAQFINKQMFFHGTKAEIDLTIINPLEGAARSELGIGIHLTHDPKVAQNYADALATRNVPPVASRPYSDLGRVYQAKTGVQSPLSATKSLEPEARIAVTNAVEALKQNPNIPKPLVDSLKRSAKSPKITYQQFMNKVEEAFNKYLEQIPEEDILSLQRNINAELRKQGYDSIFFQTKYGKNKPTGMKDDYLQVVLLGNTENNSLKGVLDPQLRPTGGIVTGARGRYNADSLAEQVFNKSPYAKANKEDSAVFLQTQMTNQMKGAAKELDNNLESFTDRMLKLENELRQASGGELTMSDKRTLEAYRKQNEDIIKHYNTPEEGMC